MISVISTFLKKIRCGPHGARVRPARAMHAGRIRGPRHACRASSHAVSEFFPCSLRHRYVANLRWRDHTAAPCVCGDLGSGAVDVNATTHHCAGIALCFVSERRGFVWSQLHTSRFERHHRYPRCRMSRWLAARFLLPSWPRRGSPELFALVAWRWMVPHRRRVCWACTDIRGLITMQS